MKLILLLLTLFCATADDCQKQAEAAEKACAADVQKFCKGVPHNKIPQCMKKHWAQLSKPCQGAIKTLMACAKCVPEQKKARTSCGPWIKKTCPKAKDPKAYWDCYLDNRSKAPKQCNADATAAYTCIAKHTVGGKCMHHDHKALEQQCKGQFHKICPNAKSREDMKKCVKANWKKFSSYCQAAMMRLHRCEMCGGSMFNWEYQCGEQMHNLCGNCHCRPSCEKCVRKNWKKFNPTCQKAMQWVNKACPHHHHHHHHHRSHGHLLGRDGHDNWRRAGDRARHAVMSWMHHFTSGHRHHRHDKHCHHGDSPHENHKDHKYCNGLECHAVHQKKPHILGKDDHDNWKHRVAKEIQHVTRIFLPTFEQPGDVASIDL